MERLAALDRVFALISDHSGNLCPNAFSCRVGSFAPSSELNELLRFILSGSGLSIECCRCLSNDESLIDGCNLSNEFLPLLIFPLPKTVGVGDCSFDCDVGDKVHSSNVAKEFSNGSSSVVGHTIQISGVLERDLDFADDLDCDLERARIERREGDLDFVEVCFLRLLLD